MLNESVLLSFLDSQRDIAFHFLEGQKLIQDLALINHFQGAGLSYFRDAVLTFQSLTVFLKPQEGFGLYIDSRAPYFMLKLETSFDGQMRTLLLPENIASIPNKISGTARLVKSLPGGKEASYTSLIKLENTSIKDIANQILQQTYQTQTEIFLSTKSDQALIIVDLPGPNKGSGQQNYWQEKRAFFEYLFHQGFNDKEQIVSAITGEGPLYLGEKTIQFKCLCSREKMLQGIKGVIKTASSPDSLFDQEKNSLEAVCDYCKTKYLILKTDVF